MPDELKVRITVVGRASKRWRGAHSQAEADKLNQKLSEARAKTIRASVEAILRKELPNLKIEAADKGVGSRDPFPTAGEDNAAVDRSALVMVDLVTTSSNTKIQLRPPRKVYARTRLWQMTVLALADISNGAQATFARIKLKNGVTGRSLNFSGYFFGGNLDPITALKALKDAKSNPFDLGRASPGSLMGPVGSTVTFMTDQAMDFDDWINRDGGGQYARIIHAEVGAIRKKSASMLQFISVDSSPGTLTFDVSGGWTLLDVDVSVVSGKLVAEGDNPGDMMEVKGEYGIVDVAGAHRNSDGVLLSFPTEKAGLSDLADSDRKRLSDFVVNKARAIKALSDSFKVTSNPP
jgi:hypothetical protein